MSEEANGRSRSPVDGSVSRGQADELNQLVKHYGLSKKGDLLMLDDKWYITHAGLLRLARKRRCVGIHTEMVTTLCNPAQRRWVAKATVYKSPRSKGFVGLGDADPTNVAPLLRGAEMRMAETRAVNRALRKAYGIGICSAEELPGQGNDRRGKTITSSGNGNRKPRLRDRLLLLIRKYRLDAEQVKRYAAHFCGTAALRDASREQVQKLVDHLELLAAEGRDRLITELVTADEAPRQAGPTQEDQAEQSKEAA